ncbi:substrate-binding domain-containing protein [Roseitranquillus sediminis]|uniref:substrate-binding domain-containing protein n=1 Tax=Roseitranquillus sediminis TaxID=2809051 RepID=UPI001D0C4650|nr:substrate-binding domain-containing protein [Roseitranquillus sediminis]MBM9595422.1 substrate-binding domain-containing protein [Roseitranquillus sediminis]
MPLKVLSSLAVERALTLHLLPSFEAAEGSAPDVEWNPTKVMMDRIRGGARGDVTILIDDSMAELANEGIVDSATITPIATARMGFAVAPGAPKPDLSNADAVRETLLAARSVAFSQAGASGQFFVGLLERLGIADEVTAKASIIPEGFTAREIVAGRADLAIQQISELMTVDGVDIAGPLPPELQKDTDFSVALFAEASDPAAGRRFLDHLTTPEAAEAYRKGGLVSRLAEEGNAKA